MEQNDLEQELQQVHALKKSFSADSGEQTVKPKLMQRVGKKRTYWYVQPFGEAQNSYNAAAAETLSALGEQVAALQQQLDALKKQTEQDMAAFRQEQRQALGIQRGEQQEALSAAMAAVDKSIAGISPETRADAGISPLTELPVIGTEALFQAFHTVQNAQTPAETSAALRRLEENYGRLLHESLEKQEKKRPLIALICRDYAQRSGLEAVCNEVRDIYALLRRASRYPVCIVSVTRTGEAVSSAEGVWTVPERCLKTWLSDHKPALAILFGSTPELLTAAENALLLQNSIVRLTAQNPVQGLGGSRLEELTHLCDHGVQQYLVASEAAADAMEAAGFRRPKVLYPYFADRFVRTPRTDRTAEFTVGFASSPMEQQQANSRGLPALCEVIRQNPELHFVILWRDEQAAPLPEFLKTAQNVELHLGKYDMSAFYSTIDCLLIPYADADFNHACPLSALEAMSLGIPAAVTAQSGAAEIVRSCGLGEVINGTDAEAISAVLRQIREQLLAYSEPWRAERLREIRNQNKLVQLAEASLNDALPQEVPTLYEWDRQLQNNKQKLVRGHDALKAHYSQEEVAENYAATRFSEYPQNCFDLMERESVKGLLEHYFPQRNDLKLLDLASGTGRILQMLMPFGQCTACDAAPVMLHRIKERFPEQHIELRGMDLLQDGLRGQYDVITVFRFLRHYSYRDRKQLWATLRGALKPGGMLLFDVPNRRFELPHRAKNGWGNYPIYDVFWTKEAIAEELSANGFCLKALVPVGQGLYPLPHEFRGEPMTYTAGVVRSSEFGVRS